MKEVIMKRSSPSVFAQILDRLIKKKSPDEKDGDDSKGNKDDEQFLSAVKSIQDNLAGASQKMPLPPYITSEEEFRRRADKIKEKLVDEKTNVDKPTMKDFFRGDLP
jgi:hypothetical protein